MTTNLLGINWELVGPALLIFLFFMLSLVGAFMNSSGNSDKKGK